MLQYLIFHFKLCDTGIYNDNYFVSHAFWSTMCSLKHAINAIKSQLLWNFSSVLIRHA